MGRDRAIADFFIQRPGYKKAKDLPSGTFRLFLAFISHRFDLHKVGLHRRGSRPKGSERSAKWGHFGTSWLSFLIDLAALPAVARYPKHHLGTHLGSLPSKIKNPTFNIVSVLRAILRNAGINPRRLTSAVRAWRRYVRDHAAFQ